MPSFVPDSCLALGLKALIDGFNSISTEIDLPSASAQFTASVSGHDASISQIGELQTSLGDIMQCLFDAAGETMPTLPTLSTPPDLSGAQTAATELSNQLSELTDPLAVFGSAVTITFDGNGLPTQIDF